MKKIIALDIGSSAIKTNVFVLNEEIQLLYSCNTNIGLYSPKAGYAEHDPEEVWKAVCESIQDVFMHTGVKREEIDLISICSQAQCVVLVDKDGVALTPIYNSQDGRAVDSFYKYYSHGIKVVDLNIFKAVGCFISTGFLPGSAKDPVFKYKWAQDHLPETYEKTYKWLDIKDYILCRMTGEFVTTKDNANAYTIYNSKENKGNWGKLSAKIFEIDMEKLPKVVDSFTIIGNICEKSASEMGLSTETQVIGGVIDTTGVQYGAGAVDIGETIIYWGTSGWVGTVVSKLVIDPIGRMGALVSARTGLYHYYACLESAGISYQWLKEHIVKNDNVMLGKAEDYLSEDDIYDYMNQAIKQIPAGSDGVMYAPWITGCRAPMEATDIGGIFLNIKNSMDKRHLIRAVVEGNCYHYRLLYERSARKIKCSKVIRFVGGGAKSDEIAQILADVTGCKVEVPKNPQAAGAYGAAIVGFYTLEKEKCSFTQMVHKQKAEKIFVPIAENQMLYNKYYKVYKQLYRKNKRILSTLTAIADGKEKEYECI